METNQAKEYFVSRVQHFLNKAKTETDPQELEAIFYAIAGCAGNAQNRFHDLHDRGPHESVSV